MSKKGDRLENAHKSGISGQEPIIGLEAFRKRLEKDFYSDVNVYNYSSKGSHINLSIEFDSNFNLSEALYHLSHPISPSINHSFKSPGKATRMLDAFMELRNQNTAPIDISELTLVLTDTTILISKIYEQSIFDQLEQIATAISRHHIYYTKGLTETPAEIYIPVFEEDSLESNSQAEYVVNQSNNNHDYFIFWGVYYESTKQAAIYDLETKKIIRGDIHILSE